MTKNILTCFIILLSSAGAFGQDYNAKLNALMSHAKKLMKYKGHVTMPELRFVPASTLHKMFCAPSKPCPVAALYYDNAVFIDSSLSMDDPYTESVIVHEYVHHIQSIKYGNATDCTMWLRNEREAYRHQAKYLSIYDKFDVVNRETLKTIKCPF
jgi:hypothetical protein